MKRILVTGATGFIGSALIEALSAEGRYALVAAVRDASAEIDGARPVVVESLSGTTDWQRALEKVDTVVHCAARVHVMNEKVLDPLAEFRRVNVEGTLNLGRQAARAGVKRFIFISSIKVNGETTTQGEPFVATDAPDPVDPYAISKQEAEAGLRDVSESSSMEVVIIRPPLVYGPGVEANFRTMMMWVRRGIPMPLGAIHNRRSMVSLGNLVDLITTCIEHPAAANQTFLVSDGEDLSTSALLKRMGEALGTPARLWPLPAGALALGARMLGKNAIVDRLLGSLQVDMTPTRETLGWEPSVGVDEALKKTADAFGAAWPKKGGEEKVGVAQTKLIRAFDIGFSLAGLGLGFPVLMALVGLGYLDTGSPLFRQQRLGRNKRPFTMVKFRTMRPETASVATHLADASAITPLGRFMRRWKLDELPQLWNVLKGEMSLVGPRPGLLTQARLSSERERRGVFAARPGITGLAQVSNIDMSTPELLAETDARMLELLGVGAYFKYILMTAIGKGSGDPIDKR